MKNIVCFAGIALLVGCAYDDETEQVDLPVDDGGSLQSEPVRVEMKSPDFALKTWDDVKALQKTDPAVYHEVLQQLVAVGAECTSVDPKTNECASIDPMDNDAMEKIIVKSVSEFTIGLEMGNNRIWCTATGGREKVTCCIWTPSDAACYDYCP